MIGTIKIVVMSAFLATAPACSPDAEPEPTPTKNSTGSHRPVTEPLGEMSSLTRTGNWNVSWRSLPDPPPVNRSFSIEVELKTATEPSDPVLGAEVFVRGWMPDHGHGMVREPRSEELGKGRYRIEGVLLHMGGHWQMTIDATVEGLSESADFEIELP